MAAVGTWAVGIMAFWIAYVQYRNAQFRPAVSAFREASGRVMIRIVNQGSGAGIVQDVNLLTPRHLAPATNAELVYYDWEIDKQKSDVHPLPFPLEGGGSADLFLIVNPGDKSLHDFPLDAVRIRVDYGSGKDSGCIAMRTVRFRLYGTTRIPTLNLSRVRSAGSSPAARRARSRRARSDGS
ncbi:hypothetical protein [Intrasporangium oryzae]|uniref:hypothetical protein n=1 Tax=Intrasporangium oryzae TaxID=412687 RepID=UPI0012F8F5D0|nr:hypothetical protein [Intrasporangium oryzae]